MSIESAPAPADSAAHAHTPAAQRQQHKALVIPALHMPAQVQAQVQAPQGDVLLGDEMTMMGGEMDNWAAARPQFIQQPMQPQVVYATFAAPPAQLTRHASLPSNMVPYTVMAPATPQHHVQASIPMLARHHSLGYINAMQQQQQFQVYQQPMMRSPHVGEMQQMLQLSMAQQHVAPHTPGVVVKHETQVMGMEQVASSTTVNVEPIAFTSVGDSKLPLEDLDPLAFAVFDRPMPQDIQQVESAFDSLDRLLPEVEQELLFRGQALDAFAQTTAPLMKMQMKASTPMGKSPKSMAVCKIDGCGRRVRSKGFCKTHGGGRKCSIEGCKKSSQNGDFCIGHGGGKKCKEEGCAKAAQSHGLCKAHGGGARCKFPDCNKSSQGGGLCRAHGGGKRCQAAGCPKGAQRGNFCATHGGFRNCKIDGCVRTDRGGGFCEVHRRGRLCKIDGCKKLSRNQGMCTMHIREVKQDGNVAGLNLGMDASSSSDDDGVSTALSTSLVV